MKTFHVLSFGENWPFNKQWNDAIICFHCKIVTISTISINFSGTIAGGVSTDSVEGITL